MRFDESLQSVKQFNIVSQAKANPINRLAVEWKILEERWRSSDEETSLVVEDAFRMPSPFHSLGKECRTDLKLASDEE